MRTAQVLNEDAILKSAGDIFREDKRMFVDRGFATLSELVHFNTVEAASGPEKAVYRLREMVAKRISLIANPGFAPDDAAFLLAECFNSKAFDSLEWHNSCLKEDLSPTIMRERVRGYLANGQTICDLGCGTGLATLPLLEKFSGLTLRAFDVSIKMLKQFANEALKLVCDSDVFVDVVNLDTDFDYLMEAERMICYDHVVSNGVLYYLHRPERLFEFVAKKLKPGGYFHFSVPISEGTNNELELQSGRTVNRETYLKKWHVCYLFASDQIEKLLDSNGMELVDKRKHFVHREPDMTVDTYFTYFTVRKK